MSETYVECLVNRPVSAGAKVLKAVLISMAAVAGFFGLIGNLLLLLTALACGAGAYFIGIYMDVEYEYLYLDKEITIDKVLAKSKRKRAAVLEIENMEILAPLNSWHLDNYKNRTGKTTDYSSGVAGQPETRYVMYFNNNQRIILEPNMQMVKAIQLVAPRKVFTD